MPAPANTVQVIRNNAVVGTFTSLQAAVNAAGNGDRVDVGTGTWDLSTPLSITKSLTFTGAQVGTAGTAHAGGESVLQGGTAGKMFELADASISVKFDGFSFTGDTVMAEGNPGQSITITNSVLDIVATHDNVFYMGQAAGYTFNFTNNKMAVTGYTETFQLFNDGFVTVSGNSFTGRDGTYVPGDDNDVPLILNLNAIEGSVTNNTFTHVDIGVLVADHVGPLQISGNTFTDLHRDPANGKAAGIVFYDPTYDGQIQITGNSFNDADAGIRTSGGGTDPTLEGAPIYVDGNSFTGVADPYYDNIPGSFTATNSTVNGTLVTFSGGDADDTVTSGAGNDNYEGGAGTDTLRVSGQLVAADFNYDATTNTWSVNTHGQGTDTLVHFEKVTDGAGHTFLLVDKQGSYTTIQAAVTAAGNGDTILVADGTYVEQVLVSGKTNLTIDAIGTGAILQAPADVAQTVTLSSGRGVEALLSVVGSTNVVVDGLNVDGAAKAATVTGGNDFTGVVFRNSSGTLEGVDIYGIREAYVGTLGNGEPIVSGNQRGVGLRVDNDAPAANAPLLGFTMHGGSISDFQKGGTAINRADVDISDVIITGGGAQTINAQNGIQVGNSTGTIHDNTVTDIGYAGSQTVYSGGLLLFSNTDLDVLDNTITGSNDDSTAAQVVGIYAYVPAGGAPNSGGEISGNTISYVDAGIYVTGAMGPEQVVVGENDISNVDATDPYYAGALFYAPDSDTAIPLTVNGTDGPDYLAGGAAGDTISGGGDGDYLDGMGGDDTLTGGAGDDFVDGGTGTDTATYAGTLTTGDFTYTDGQWHVAGDTLENVEVVTDTDNHTFRLVGKDAGDGYASIQAAVNAAGENDFILIAPGTYTETGTSSAATGSQSVGLYINTAGLTLQGYGADGNAVTAATVAQANGPTIIAGAQAGFGANHWVDTGGTGVTIAGVHLKAGEQTNNKLLEIWADGFTLTDSFVDVYTPSGAYNFPSAIYFNDVGNATTDSIISYTIDGNILNEGIIVSNGVGDADQGTSTVQLITNNSFIGTFDPVTGTGRYDGIALLGQQPGVGYRLEPNQVPTVSGNDFGDGTTPFVLRGLDADVTKLPDLADVQAILATNTVARFAYVIDPSTGDLRHAVVTDSSGTTNYFAVANTIDTLNLGLDNETYYDANTSDQVFPAQRIFIEAGDTVVIKSGAAALDSQIMVEDLHIRATADSADLDLTLATTFADRTAIADGGVRNVTLEDYGSNQGANVDVTGNGLDNAITGNSGDNVLSGLGGDDTLSGGAGNDTLDGGDGDDVLTGGAANDTIAGGAGDGDVLVLSAAPTSVTDNANGTTTVVSADGTDTVSGVEAILAGTTLYVFAGMSIQAAINAADDGDTIVVAAGTYVEQLSIANRAGLTIEAAPGATVVVQSPDAIVASGTSGRFGEAIYAVIGVTNSTGITIRDIAVDGDYNGESMRAAVGGGSNGFELTGVAYLQSSGTLDNVDVAKVGDDPAGGFFGVQRGSGIFIDGTGTAALSVSVIDSAITQFQKTGVLAFGVALTFTGNTVSGIGATALTGQNGLQIADVTGTVDGNTIDGLGYVAAPGDGTYASGIIAYEPAGGLTISNNTVTGAAGGQAAGLDLSDTSTTTGTILVDTNHFSTLQYGIYAYTYTGGTTGLDHATITGNDFADISVEGIHFAPEESYGARFSTTNGFVVGGSDFADTLSGSNGTDVLSGAGGDDTLTGDSGDDTLNGDDGTDTAVFAGNAADATINTGGNGFVTGFTTVTTADGGRDTLTSVERLVFADATLDSTDKVQLFDSNDHLVGTFDTIQAAIDAADPDATIRVAAGDFAENLVISTAGLTLIGASGRATTIRPGSSDATDGNVITVRADGVTIDGFTITGANSALDASGGVLIGSVKSHAARLVSSYKDSLGAFATDDLTVVDNTLSYGQRFGVVLYNAYSGGNLIENNDFSGMSGLANGSFRTAILLDTEAYADVKNNRMVDVGQGIQASTLGRGDPDGTPMEITGNTISAQRAIFVNNIYSAASEVVIADNIISHGATTAGSAANQVGIRIWSVFNGGSVEVHDNAVSGDFTYGYRLANNPGEIVIEGGSVIGAKTAVEVYDAYGFGNEAGENVVTLSGVTISGSTVANLSVADSDTIATPQTIQFDAANQPTLGDAPVDVLLTGNTAKFDANGYTGDLVITGNGADNELAGGAGDDQLNGGLGTDTAQFEGNAGDATIVGTRDASGLYTSFTEVTTAAGGTDSLSSIERLQFADGTVTLAASDPVQLFDANDHLVGTYGTIQAAIDAASDGFTIRAAAGTYAENLQFDVGVTLLGAHAGEDGDATGRGSASAGETNLIGRHDIFATAAVTIDGVRFVNTSATTGGQASDPILQIRTGADHVVENSVFYSEVNGAARPGPDDRAISMPVIGSGSITIEDNYFTGAFASGFGGGSWGRAVWFDGGGVDLTVSGNTVEYSRTGFNLDISGTSNVTATDNTFRTSGTAYAVGVSEDHLTTTGNVFDGYGEEFNFRNLSDPVTFDAGAAVTTLTGDDVDVLGGHGADHLYGTAFSDTLDGNQLSPTAETDADILEGRGGTDLLLGRGGDDTLVGGADNDALFGGAGDDTAVVTGTYTVTAASGGWTVTSSDGTDSLDDIEIVTNGTARTLLVGNGGYLTLADAMADAADGDTILLAAGSYAGNATVDKDVTIKGANAGVAGTSTGRGAESVLSGTILVTAADVTFDGVEFTGQGSAGGGAFADALISSGNNLTITNSIFAGTPAASGTSAAIELSGTGIDIGASLFSGYDVGIYVAGAGSTGSIHDNRFQGIDGTTANGMGNGVNTETTGVVIEDNVFDALYSGSITSFPQAGGAIDLNDYIIGNTFSNTSVARPVQFIADAAGITSVTGTDANEALRLDESANVTQGVTADAGAGDDAIYATNFDDVIYAGDGDDTIYGNDGTDTLVLRGGFGGYDVNDNGDGSFTITDTDTSDGDDGTDTVFGVETVRLGGVNGTDYDLADLPDDAPIANDDANSVTEDAVTNTATGNVLSNDTNTDDELGDDLTVTGAGVSGTSAGGVGTVLNGTYGTVTIGADGAYTYTLDNSRAATQALAACGTPGTDTFTYEVSDTGGQSDTAQLVITVNGTNDAPVAGPPGSGSVREAGNLDNGTIDAGTPSASGTLTSTDVDTGATATWSGSANGTYGTFTIGANGAWNYQLDNSRTATNALAEGDSRTETFTASVSDGQGGNASQTVTVTVTGTNDSPVAVGESTSATEDGSPVTGSVATNDSDPDAGATRSYALTGTVPGLTLAGDGGYSFDPSNAAYQHLAAGQQQVVTANYAVTDDKGATATAALAITVTGTNDRPVLTGVTGSPIALTESTVVSNDNFGPVSGSLQVNDVDTGNAVTGEIVSAVATWNGPGSPPAGLVQQLTTGEGGGTPSSNPALTFGSVTPNGATSNLSYTYDPGSASTNQLSEEQTLTITYTVRVKDALSNSVDTRQIVVTIQGTNEVLIGTPDDDVLNGGSSADDISGLAGDDSISGAGGDDDIYGGAGDDSVLAGAGNDTVYGEDGDDSIDGGSDNDTIYGGTGDDTLNGGSGNDVIYAGSGNDSVNGGSGTDTLVLDGSWRDYTVTRIGSTYMFATATDEVVATQIENVSFSGGASGPFAIATTINDAPVAGNDTGASGNVLGNDTDADAPLGDSLTVTGARAGTEAAGGSFSSVGSGTTITGRYGTLTINPNGSYSYVVDGNDPDTLALGNGSATETFTYQVTDAKGLTDAAQITIAVTGTNAAPTGPATGTLAGGTEDTTRVITAAELLQGFSDPNGDTLTVQNLTTDRGTITPNGNGTYNLTLPADQNGAVTLTYQVSDGRGGTANASRGLTFAAVNDAPVANGDGFTVAEDGTLTGTSVLANDSDVDSSGLTAQLVTGPSHGTLTLNADGTFVYTPTANYSGTDSFTYRASDGAAQSAPATVTISVTPVNDAPVAVDDAYTTAEDTALTVSTAQLVANDTDADGDVRTVTSVGNATGGTVVLSGGNVTFTPTANFNGAAGYDYTISDGNGGTSTAHVAVTVTPVNDNPVANGETLTTNEDTAITVSAASLTANDTDVDNDSLTVTSVGNASNGIVSLAGGQVTFTPSANYNGPASFDYTVSDGNGGTSTATVTVTVNPVNDAPVAVADTLNATEDTPVTFTAAQLLGNDTDVDNADGDLSIASVTSGPGGTAVLVNGEVQFTPNADFNGTASFTYTVTDGQATSAPATATVNVAATNDAPVAAADTLTTNEDTALTIAASSLTANDSDVDGDGLTVVGVGNATNGTVSLSGGQITFAPAANYFGTATFDYTVSDGNGGSSTATVTVTVNSINDAPVATPDTLAATEDTPATYSAAQLIGNDTDADAGDTLTLVSVTSGTGGTVSLSGGVVTFTPTANFNGPASFTYEVSDGTTTTTGSATVNVAPTNDAPVAVADTFTTAEDTPLTVPASALTANDTDVDGDNLTVTSVGNASNGTVTLSNGQVVFTPNADFHGIGGYDYTISDGNGGVSSEHVTVTVTPVNDAPVANADSFTVNEDATLSIAASALTANDTDADNNALTVTSVGNATNGTVSLSGGQVTFVPTADFNGPASFTYTVSDGTTTSTGTVNVTVAPVNDAPVANPDTLSATEDTTATYSAALLTANDTDIDGDPRTVTSVTSGTGGTVSLSGGQITFVPTANFNGPASFTYTVSDGTTTSTASVTVNVAAVNDTATITGNSTGSVTEDGTLTASGSLAVNDVDTGEATFQAPSSLTGAYGTFSFNTATGQWSYQLNNASPAVQALNTGQSVTDQLTVQSADGTATRTIVVTINGQDEAPTGIYGTPNNDTVYGTGAADDIYGLAGDDILIGLAGADRLFGGDGSDTASYAGSAAGVTVNLLTNTATGGDAAGDTYDSIENLTGSSFNDTLTGNGAANVLDGGAGNDTMAGGGGNDTYVVDQTGDVVTEAANAGTDTVRTSLASYTLGANLENLVYTGAVAFTGNGNALNNVITGGAGNDRLDGKAGADTMIGLGGDDVYTVDDAGDVVVEAANGGTDTVNAGVDYTLGAEIENLYLTGLARSATGNALNNFLRGTTGNDRLDGGTGADNMTGYAGDDTYIIDNAGDIIVEKDGDGYDTVETTLNSLVLRTFVEKLVFTGTGDFTGTGNTENNYIIGGAGNDKLDGRNGADTMVGLGGDDTYAVDNVGDVIVETISGGYDTVAVETSDYTVSDFVERVTLGTSGRNVVAGAGNTTIIGNGYVNRIDGGAGADTMTGFAGNDTFVFQKGQAAGDAITDFAGAGVAGGDVLEFRGYGTGTIVNLGGGQYQITADAAHGSTVEVITLTGVGVNLIAGDYVFL